MCGTSEPVGQNDGLTAAFSADAVCRNAKYTLAFGHKNDILHVSQNAADDEIVSHCFIMTYIMAS